MKRFLSIIFTSLFVALISSNANAVSCNWGDGCTMTYCTYAETIYDSGSDTCPCSCLGSCVGDYVAQTNADGSVTCVPGGQHEMDPCEGYALTDVCDMTTTIIGGGSVVKVSYTARTTFPSNVLQPCRRKASTYCSLYGVSYMCNIGYYNLTGSGDSSTCTQCPAATDMWTDSTHTTPVRGTTSHYVNTNDPTQCCMVAGTYYDVSGTFDFSNSNYNCCY